MNDTTLPYLKCLRETFHALSAQQVDPVAARQIAVSSRLLDFMIAQRTVSPKLKTEAYAAFLDLVPSLEMALSVSADKNKANATLQKLQEVCMASDPDAFTQFLLHAAELQDQLLKNGTAQATALCKAVLQIETKYSKEFESAVADLHANITSKRETESSGATNTKDFDEKKLLDFMRRAFPDETTLDIKRCSFVAGGFSKITLGIELSGAKFLPEHIILRSEAGTVYSGASVIDEYRLIKVLHENGVSVPKPLALEESGKIFGTPFLLVEKKPGTVIGHILNLPKPNVSVSHDVAVKLAAIHSVPLPSLTPCFGDAVATTSSTILKWLEADLATWRALNMPSPVFETAFNWLRRNVGINDKAPRTLVHGDYGLQNILIDKEGVSTILDWEFGHIGNPAYDLGYFYDQAESLSSWDDFLQAYAKTGTPVPDEDQLNYCILLAATRLGVITGQMRAAFESETNIGITVAWMVGENHYEEFVQRIAKALERVL